MARVPQSLPGDGSLEEHYIEGVVSGKTGRILVQVMESGEPFFILRAKDIFTPMVIRDYLRLIEQYAPDDYHFQEALVEIMNEIKQWQKDHGEQVRYPD